MPETTFTGPDLTTFLGLDALGLTAVGQYLTAKHAVIECRMPIGFEDPFCRACGAQGQARGTVARRLARWWRPWSRPSDGVLAAPWKGIQRRDSHPRTEVFSALGQPVLVHGARPARHQVHSTLPWDDPSRESGPRCR